MGMDFFCFNYFFFVLIISFLFSILFAGKAEAVEDRKSSGPDLTGWARMKADKVCITVLYV